MSLAKDTDIAASARPVANSHRPEDASAGRPQPVALEVSVTVNGATTIAGGDKRAPFSESTKTVVVFSNGAVVRLTAAVAAGQLLFLMNEKTQKEVVCQVVKSKNCRHVSGCVELEFTEIVVGFWGMRFPGDRLGPPSVLPGLAARSGTAGLPAAKAEGRTPDGVPHVDARYPAPAPPRATIETPAPCASVNTQPFAIHSADSVAGIPRVPERKSAPAVLPSAPPGSQTSANDLQPETALVLGEPSAVFEIVQTATVVKTSALPAPAASPSIDGEAVQIPSWLAPPVRDPAAAEPVPEPVRQTTRLVETKEFENSQGPVSPALQTAGACAPAAPIFRGTLLEENSVLSEKPFGGSHKGVFVAAMAASVLFSVAGGAWFLRSYFDPAPGTAAAITRPAERPAEVSRPQNPLPSSGAEVSQAVLATHGPASWPANAQPAAPAPQAVLLSSRTKEVVVPQPVPSEPEQRKPALGAVHLAAPTVHRKAGVADNALPVLGLGGAEIPSNPEAPASSLTGGRGKQPAFPDAVGGGVKTARLISSARPVYPTLAQNQHVEGNVRIDALIDAFGQVSTMKVVSGPTLLQQAALDALRQWKYQPATFEGKGVPMHLTVTIQFRLQ